MMSLPLANNNHNTHQPRGYLKGASIFLALFSVMAFVAWPQEKIEVSAPQWHCVLPETQFILKWRHSVEHQYWQEVYHLERHGLRLSQTYMQTFGAGTPSNGTPIAAPKGYIGQESQVWLPEINWVVSRNMQGEIWLPHTRFAINQRVADYTPIHIQPMQKARIAWLFEDVCHD